MTDVSQAAQNLDALETMVAEADTGGRKPTGVSKAAIFGVSLSWALFQLWYASPLPYIFNIGVVNDGQARVIHLSFAFLLAFTTFPALKSSPRKSIPITDWILAILGVGAATYLLLFYKEISLRPGLPTLADVVLPLSGWFCCLKQHDEPSGRAGSHRGLDARLHLGWSLATGYAGA